MTLTRTSPVIATVTIVISTASPSSGRESESFISGFVHLKKETCIKPDDGNNFRFIMPSKYWGDGLAEAPPPAEDAGVALQASHVNIGTIEARPSHRLEEPQLHTPSRGLTANRRLDVSDKLEVNICGTEIAA